MTTIDQAVELKPFEAQVFGVDDMPLLGQFDSLDELMSAAPAQVIGHVSITVRTQPHPMPVMATVVSGWHGDSSVSVVPRDGKICINANTVEEAIATYRWVDRRIGSAQDAS